MTPSHPPHDLALVFEALHQRASREILRLDGQAVLGTEIVGGWAKIGALLDTALKQTFTQLCLDAGRDTDAEFARLSGPSRLVFQRATAGQCVMLLPRLAQEIGVRDARCAAVLAAVVAPRSVVHAAVEMRNTLVHGREAPSPDTLRAVLAPLARWAEAVARAGH